MKTAIGRFQLFLAACAASSALLLTGCPPPETEDRVTAEDAAAFLEEAEAELLEVWVAAERANWELSTNITPENEKRVAETDAKRIEVTTKKALETTRFDGLDLPYDVDRRLGLLKLTLNLPAPSNPEETAELAQLAAAMESAYGSGEYCGEDGECRDLEELSDVIDDPANQTAENLLEVWRGWRTVSRPLEPQFERYVELVNKGARDLGFADFGAMWRSNYDMPPDAFAAELDRLFEQVRPLYEAIHCHVRARLAERFGDEVDPEGPIPAHLLGNMWAQTWSNVYDLVAPEGGGDPGYDLTALLEAEGVDEIGMVKYGEGFFTSLGFDPLPETFWERSLFVQPEDRKVVCHASAWDVDWEDDLRIKMCIQVNAEDFNTIHHELGHNFYQRAYNDQPLLYRESANDGFHEAVGDTIALSITPKYLVDLGLLAEEPDASADTGLLLRTALDKVAFLPFGLLIDQWRWKVFSGEVTPETYNQSWWDLRLKYQGVKPPIERSEEDFDPGAKYHVAANVSYMRYFLAHILQFQFHRGLCAAAGYEGPLHRCSIYGNAAAGEKLETMLAMGSSRPWPEALEVVTGQREMDATAILDYFAPLKEWLDAENEGRVCGW
jgi:peptidyl-dipeptidase A